MKGRKWKPGLYLQQAGDTLAFNPQIFCQQIYKNTLWYNELLNMFLHRYKHFCIAIKIAVLVSWRTTLVSLC